MALGIESPGPQCAFETSMFMCPAVHTTTRILLRPSSTHEPSDPPFRVVCSRYQNIFVSGEGRFGGREDGFVVADFPVAPAAGFLYDPLPRTPPGSAAAFYARFKKTFLSRSSLYREPGVAADAGPVAFGRHCRARRRRAGSTAPVLAPRNSPRFSRRAARADDRADAYRPTLGRAPLECRYAVTASCPPAAAECGTPPTDPVDT